MPMTISRLFAGFYFLSNYFLQLFFLFPFFFHLSNLSPSEAEKRPQISNISRRLISARQPSATTAHLFVPPAGGADGRICQRVADIRWWQDPSHTYPPLGVHFSTSPGTLHLYH